jgi:hypothetical protein
MPHNIFMNIVIYKKLKLFILKIDTSINYFATEEQQCPAVADYNEFCNSDN